MEASNAIRKSPGKPQVGKAILARLLVAVTALLLSLSVAEIVVRLTVAEPRAIRFRQLDRALAGDPRHQFMSLIQNDYELFWRLAPNIRLPDDGTPFFGLISNKQGYREDHNIPLEKAAGELRILFLGDSCTFGYMLPPEETVAAHVETLLKSKWPNRTIECINAGVPGYSVFQGWRFLETRGATLSPDLVIVNFGWNDSANWDGFSDMETYSALQDLEPPPALRWSRLARLAWRVIANEPKHRNPDATRPRLTPDEFEGLLEKMYRTTRRLGADMLLLVGGARGNIRLDTPIRHHTEYQRKQYVFADNMAQSSEPTLILVDGVEIAHQLAQSRSIGELFLDDVHPSAIVNRALADELVRKIEQWLVPVVPEK